MLTNKIILEKVLTRTTRYLLTSFEGQLLFLFCIMLFSIVYSLEFLTSQAMFFLAGVVLFKKREHSRGLSLREGNMDRLRKHSFLSPYWIITVSFFLVVISLAWSENLKVGFRWLQLKIPFIVFPLLFMMMPKLSKQLLDRLFYFLILLMAVTCIPVLYNYWTNYDAVNLLLSQGQHIPVPSNHIRFSMLMALAIIAAGYLFQIRFVLRYSWERLLLGGMGVFLVFMIHLLSVRTGIVLLYGTLFFFVLHSFFRTKSLLRNLVFIALLILGPLIAYQALPSLKSKINYAAWDFGKYKEGRVENYSDSERIVSIQAGLDIARKAPILGVGAGDLKDNLKSFYSTYHPKLKMKLPHNQFVTVTASYGLIGLLFFLFSIIKPLFYRQFYKNALFLGFNLFIIGSMLFESTLDTNYGITIYLVFLLIGMKVLDTAEHQI